MQLSPMTQELDKPVEPAVVHDIAEAIRARGRAAGVPTAVLSRGLAGVAGPTIVVNLPGSAGGCADGIAVLADVLPHAVSQVAGGDHVQLPDPAS